MGTTDKGAEPANVVAVLDEQVQYYRSRAPEYDEWYTRKGRYDHGPEANARWNRELAEVAAALETTSPWGHALELAGGTGWWTERLLAGAGSVTVVDASAEMIALNRRRTGGGPCGCRGTRAGAGAPTEWAGAGAPAQRVRGSGSGRGERRYVQSDLFAWEPDRQYDFIFFAFWLSHVPPTRFADHWERVRRCLAPGGRAFFVDSRDDPTASAVDRLARSPGDWTMRRRLNDGREFEIVKVFYEAADLKRRLRRLGWKADVRTTKTYFLYGTAVTQTPEGR